MYRILVVDDEAKIRLLIRKYAEFEGHEVTEAGKRHGRRCACSAKRPMRSILSSWM